MVKFVAVGSLAQKTNTAVILLTRAADVFIKEGLPLTLCPRKTPSSAVHIENMLKLGRLGVKIVPPMPWFYNRPKHIEEIIGNTCMKVMNQLHVETDSSGRWLGTLQF